MILTFKEKSDLDEVSELVDDKDFQAKVIRLETYLLATFDKNPLSDEYRGIIGFRLKAKVTEDLLTDMLRLVVSVKTIQDAL